MLLVFPPAIDLDNTITQIKHELVKEFSFSSTCLGKAYIITPDNESLFNWEKINSLATNVKLENDSNHINSTWEELDANEFELFSTIKFSKSIKVKSKIRLISKYEPTIVLD